MENKESKTTFDCIEKDCGRKFDSKEKLLEHYRNRHPGIQYKENPKETIKDSVTMLENLYAKINSLESQMENETVHQYNLDNMPNYDILSSSSSSSSDNENKAKTTKKKTLTAKDEFTKMINEPTAMTLAGDDKLMSSSIILPNKVIEISEEMIGMGKTYEHYMDIKEIDLSRHHLAVFRDECNISFSNLSEVVSLNLSFNWLTYSYDIRFFANLQQLFINDNKIDDITFCEHLPLLEVLNAENNEICDISPLMKCSMVQILRLRQNKIKYENSTLKTIYSLKNLRELTINDNPFIDNIFGYRHLLIYKFPWILVLDNERIEDVHRDVAKKFTMEHNPVLAQLRPNTARPTTNASLNDKDDGNDNGDSSSNDNGDGANHPIQIQTQTQFRVGNTVITKQVRVPKEQKENEPKLEKKRLPQINPELREVKNLKKENSELKEKAFRQEREINTLKLELDNLTQINQQNEIIISKYKQELSKAQDEEKTKLLHQVEVWKKEYVDLLDKTASTTNTSANVVIDTRVRPQTAQVKPMRSADFEKVIEELKAIKRKNILDDSLYEESSEENSNNNDDKDKDDDVKAKTSFNQIDNAEEGIEDEDNYDSDPEIDEICRKSFQNMKEIQTKPKDMENQFEQKKNILQQSNISNSISKPVISTSKPMDLIQPALIINASVNKPLLTKNIKLTSVLRNKSLPKENKETARPNKNLFN